MDPSASDILERVRRFALPGAISQARGTWLRQRGEIRLRPDRPWLPFRAQQRIDAEQLGFRWEARVRMAPLVWVKVTDAFEEHRGLLEVRFLRLRLSRATGPEIDLGEAFRLLAELPWCPFALGHPALTWSAADDRTLCGALKVGAAVASVTMDVDDSGRIVRCQAEGRPREVGKHFVPTSWCGEFGEYREMGGVRVPVRAEVAWTLPEGRFTYYRGEVLEASVVGPR